MPKTDNTVVNEKEFISKIPSNDRSNVNVH